MHIYFFQSKSEAEKEVIEILQKALQYCDFDENSPKLPLYQYRAAVIHYRIGSLYHSHIWSTANDSVNRKNIIQLAKNNYEKAAKLYFLSSDVVNYFTAQMQRLALSEYLVESKYNLFIYVLFYNSKCRFQIKCRIFRHKFKI